MHVQWCESRVEVAQQPEAPNKCTCPRCCWANGAHLNPNGATGPARAGLSRAAMPVSWPRSKAGAEGQLQSRQRVQPVWHSTPVLLVGLALQRGARCCQWVPLGISSGFHWGLLLVPR